MHTTRRAFLKTTASGMSLGAFKEIVGRSTSAAEPAYSSATDDLCFMSGRELARLLHDGRLSAREVMAAHLRQIGRLNGRLNAIVAKLDDDRCLALAEAADARRARGEPLGPLHGLPIAIKDTEPAVGFPFTRGSPIYRDELPKTDSVVVERLRNAGALLIGKTNVPEFAMGSHTYNNVYGTTVNPYDLNKSAGGSSGGAAAALAAGLIPIANGSDLGGSLRNPGNFNNVVGFRPTIGLVPTAPSIMPFGNLAVKGPMARNVADVALIHAAITQQAELAPADLRGVRIGLPRAYYWETLDPDVAKIMDTTLDKLRSAGAVLVDVDFTDLVKTALAVRAPLRLEDFRTDLAAFLAGEYPVMTMKDATPRILSKRVRILEEDAWNNPPSREAVEKARSTMDVLGTQYQDAFRQQNIVAIAHPTMPFPAPLLPTDGDALPPTFEVGGRQYPDTAILRNALPSPAFRAPGLSIPAGLTRDGLPVGFEIDGLPGGDNQLLRLGMGIEALLEPLPPPTFRNG
jgi:Asp-tRNA(Asn)/Glu-tRNA(Gln) amidotransferase A subunit family amidase